jgi:hypothetical protein
MNMDKIFDMLENNPLRIVLGMWALAAVVSILSLTVVVLIILGLLRLFGVI